MKQFIKFLTKLKSFWKLYQDYGYDGKTLEFIIENYQYVLQNRTKTMGKPTYYAGEVINQIDSWYEDIGYVRIARMGKPKYIRDKFKSALQVEELAELLHSLKIDCKKCSLEEIEDYLEKKCETIRDENCRYKCLWK